jgi:hypothetical protein
MFEQGLPHLPQIQDNQQLRHVQTGFQLQIPVQTRWVAKTAHTWVEWHAEHPIPMHATHAGAGATHRHRVDANPVSNEHRQRRSLRQWQIEMDPIGSLRNLHDARLVEPPCSRPVAPAWWSPALPYSPVGKKRAEGWWGGVRPRSRLLHHLRLHWGLLRRGLHALTIASTSALPSPSPTHTAAIAAGKAVAMSGEA